MTMPAEKPLATPGRLRLALIVLAAIESAAALSGLPGIFYEFNPTTPIGKFAQALTSIDLALAPVFALTALYFAAAGHLRYALMAIAIRILVSWASDLPSIAIHGLELSTNLGGLHVFAARFLAPVIALSALRFAFRNEHLWIATILVALPTIAKWAGVLAFAIGVVIYGF